MDDLKKSPKRIGIVGHFGGKELFTDGQTVKVKSLSEGLSFYYPNITIDKVDTYYLNKNPFKFGINLLKCLFRDHKIVFLPAARGREYMFCFFYFLSTGFKKDVYHDCIAGSLDREIANHPKWVKYLNSFIVNWMESPEQVEKLRKMGINNAEYLPNFKHIEPVSLDEMRAIQYEKPYRFCTFSRVEPKKGIEDALRIIQEINNAEGVVAQLDVYGPVQPGYEDWFEQIKNTYKNILNYKDVVDPHDSVDVLKSYFALLFPTQYLTEGMPGTIIDAMFAGLPVIARRWVWCDNMIQSGYNGISYDFDHPELLKEILLEVISDPNRILSMKENCLKESEKYSEKVIVERIYQTLGLK
jgi:glycosyltransferase involved in cell wall biosynthesis